MKSITVHNIDDYLMSIIREKSKNEHISLNQAIKDMIEQASGVRNPAKLKTSNAFAQFSGLWSKDDLSKFNEAVSDCSKIDMKDWQ
jgi:hypothetical protein